MEFKGLTRMHDHITLILDSEGWPVAESALQLDLPWLNPAYSTDLDELVLLSREYADRIGALVVSSEGLATRLSRIRKQVLDPIGLPMSALIPVGERPPNSEVASLLTGGVRWGLWTPFERSDFEFVVGMAHSEGALGELRSFVRVPTELPCVLRVGSDEQNATVNNVSPEGAFLACEHRPPTGARVGLSFRLANHSIDAVGEVVWAGSDGIGLRFDGLGALADVALRDHAQKQVRAFELVAND
jgi:hypothetical protein